ncbi:hypothetical protein DV515_00011213, partial [Chloebia gouldiae]
MKPSPSPSQVWKRRLILSSSPVLESPKRVFPDKATNINGARLDPKYSTDNLQEQSLSILMLSAKLHSWPVFTIFKLISHFSSNL